MIMAFVLLFILGYLLGSVPSAYIAARLSRGIDIREYGSGNVGGSNLFKLVPLWVAVPAFSFDIVKGVIPVYIAARLSLSFTEQTLVGVAAIAGHNWPLFLKFNGGRGMATTLGTMLVLMPKLTVVLLIMVLFSIVFHQMAVFTLIAVGLFAVASYFSGIPAAGYLVGSNLDGNEQITASLALTAVFLIMVIRRLTAPKSEFASSSHPVSLYFNRLLWDRDIRDRQTWVNRNINGENVEEPKEGGQKR